jgi:hypothetical protein
MTKKKALPAASKDATRTALRNRIISSGMISPKKLLENPENWRGHPLKQEQVVEGSLEEVGWVRDVLINKRTGHMVDGHLRVKIANKRGEKLVPYSMIDVSQEEERIILATLDPSSEMAEMNKEILRPLLGKITVGSVALQKLLSQLEEDAGVENAGGVENETLFDQSVQLQPNREYVVIVCANEPEWDSLRERLNLRTVRRGGYKRGSAFDATSIERVIPAERFLKIASAHDHRSTKPRKANPSSDAKTSSGLRGLRSGKRSKGLRAGEGAKHRRRSG